MGKSGPNATFNLFFLGVGVALGWGVCRFHNDVYMFSNPTEFSKSQTPYSGDTVVGVGYSGDTMVGVRYSGDTMVDVG